MLDDREVKYILSELINNQDRAVISLIHFEGLTLNEIVRLTIVDINVDQLSVTITADNSASREIVVCPQTMIYMINAHQQTHYVDFDYQYHELADTIHVIKPLKNGTLSVLDLAQRIEALGESFDKDFACLLTL